MNFKLTIIALFFSFAIQAQEKKQNDTIKIEINTNTKTIYLLGGIASVITKEDLAFAKKYNIQSIPATYILDANGIIVAKDLRGDQLKAKVKELLGV